MEKEIKVKSLQKSLKLLECFNASSNEMGITQLSQLMGISKSNAHNIVSTFQACGYLEKNPDNDKYSLGLKMLEFSYAINKKLDYQRSVYDVMYNLSNDLNVVCYFAIPSNGKVLYLYNTFPITGVGNYPYRTILGECADFYCTSIGKAILAFLPKEEAEIHIQAPKIRYTENTITDSEQLREELNKIRQVGYSIDDVEHELGIKCMGIPIMDHNGKLVGGLSISTANISFDQHKEIFEIKIKEAAFKIKDRI